MKKSLLLLFIGITSLCFSQDKEKIRGDKNVIQTTIDLDDFNSLEVKDNLEITFSTQNNQNSYTLNTDANLHEIIKFEIIDSVLTIQTSARIRSKKKLEITLHAKELKKITLFDDSKLNQIGALVTDNFDFVAHGNTKAKLDVKAKYIKTVMTDNAYADFRFEADTIRMVLSDKIDIDGVVKASYLDLGMYKNAEANFNGNCKNARINMAGKPSLKATNMIIEKINIRESNSSIAKINCSIEVNLFLEDKSRIYIYNSPHVIIEGIRDNAEIIKR